VLGRLTASAGGGRLQVDAWRHPAALGVLATILCLLPCLTFASSPARAGTLVATQISAGLFHSCAIRPSGQAACWGSNEQGQLGDGTSVNRATPSAVVGLTDATMISAGSTHSCAIRGSGQVVCWGANSLGELGDGTSTARTTPTPAAGLIDAVYVSAGAGRTCAIRAGGQAYCWGANENGGVGDGTFERRLIPTPVSGLSDAVTISAGGTRTCAVRVGGQAVCWGHDTSSSISSSTPEPVSGLSDAVDIQVDGGSSHNCAIRAIGQAVCWGINGAGQVGNGTQNSFGSVPTPVNVLADTTRISVGGIHTCAVRTSGQTFCWGSNEFGQLGQGLAGNPVLSPNVVSGLPNGAQVSAGGLHTCALNASSQAFCWGYNSSGQLGDGTTGPRFAPTPVLDDAGVGVATPPLPVKFVPKEPKKKGNQVGLVCGDAKFAFHAINAAQATDFVGEGDRACMLVLSNEVTRELGAGVVFTSALILSRFGTLLLDELGERSVKKEASSLRKRLVLKGLSRLLGSVGQTLSRTNAIFNVGKGVAMLMVPYVGSVHYKQVMKHGACTRILLAQDGGKLRLGGGVLFSPAGLHNPKRDAYLTEASVWRQEQKRLRRDEWTRVSSGLSCSTAGRVEPSFSRNQMFSSPVFSVLGR
jgi:alpha-tubulin suppressor-like RCC1 family protein